MSSTDISQQNESEVSYNQRGEVAHNSAQYNKIY